jgi:integrase
MASIRRVRYHKDGSPYWSVLYTFDGQQTSTSFNIQSHAESFRDLVNRVGARRAMEIEDVPLPKSRASKTPSLTVEQWLTHHIDHLTGVEQGTIDLYRMFVRVDIAPVIGDIPLAKLTEEDISNWVTTMTTTLGRKTGRPPAANSVRHKHAFLSGALSKAVPRHIPANPAAGRRLPRTIGDEDSDDISTRMLSRVEFTTLLAAITEPWRPLVEFLVASGCRWGELAGLKPGDINRDAGTVRIIRAWKHSASAGYVVGAPKTKRSRRTINVSRSVLDKLDYSHEWLFVNRFGGPVRYHNFRAKIWRPAVLRSGLSPLPKIHDLRHTCASWMLNAGIPITTVSRHLGHESIAITADIYGDVDRTSHQGAADVMGELLAAPAQKAIEGPKPVQS